MVKFRCQRCAQKIAIDDDGIGVTVKCPTCFESLVAPPRTDNEFISHRAETVPMELVVNEPAPPRPTWQQLIIQKLIPALLAQRRHLIQNQDAATEQLAALEQRVVLVQMKFQRRLSYYQERVETLEAEKRELSRQVRVLTERPVSPFAAGRVSLRDAGFLLRT